MTDEQPEALRLADILQHKIPTIKCLEIAASELRRLHQENEQLKAVRVALQESWEERLFMLEYQRDTVVEQKEELLALLNEVRMHFTRDNDLLDNLLPLIDATIAQVKKI